MGSPGRGRRMGAASPRGKAGTGRAGVFPGAVAFAALALAGCAEAPSAPPRARPYADPGFVAAGNVRIYYALTLTGDLPSGIAGSYGVPARSNLALLTVALVPTVAGAAPRTEAAELDAAAVNLLGERQPLVLRRIDEDGGPTYLATVTVHDREPVTIEIRARVAADAPEIVLRWTREFYLE